MSSSINDCPRVLFPAHEGTADEQRSNAIVAMKCVSMAHVYYQSYATFPSSVVTEEPGMVSVRVKLGARELHMEYHEKDQTMNIAFVGAASKGTYKCFTRWIGARCIVDLVHEMLPNHRLLECPCFGVDPAAHFFEMGRVIMNSLRQGRVVAGNVGSGKKEFIPKTGFIISYLTQERGFSDVHHMRMRNKLLRDEEYVECKVTKGGVKVYHARVDTDMVESHGVQFRRFLCMLHDSIAVALGAPLV